MFFMKQSLIYGFWLTLLLFPFISSCQPKKAKCDSSIEVSNDFLIDSTTLTVLTSYGSTSYFNYRGQDMGFQYELCSQFADFLNVKLNIVIAKNHDEMIEKLLNGEADLIACNLPVTKELKERLHYCGEEFITHQVLVQRQSNRSHKALTDVTQLIGKEVYIKPGRYHQRLIHLNDEIGGGIRIHLVENDSITSEDLITQVATGKIDYTITDNDVAKVNKTYYPRLDIRLQISFDQKASWAVRKEATRLAEEADRWHNQSRSSVGYTASMKRYFESSKSITHYSILSLREGKISHFDPLFKTYSKQIGWDWRLLASLAYTESNFDTTAVSWAGAKGLMQLMPRTARIMGVPAGKETNPEESIKAACKYIALTEKSFQDVTDPDEKNKFVLAAYNSGLGHIQDAIALARKYGKDPLVWTDNVEKYILLKSNEEYYSDPVCRFGYFRGTETFRFVRDIYSRFKVYQQKIKE